MDISTTYPRLNIYLDDAVLRTRVKVAAASQNVTISAYCLEAIRERLAADGFLPVQKASQPDEARPPAAAARALDRLRHQVGPIGMPVRDLIAEGRRR